MTERLTAKDLGLVMETYKWVCTGGDGRRIHAGAEGELRALLAAADMAHDLLDVARAADDTCSNEDGVYLLTDALATFRARWPGVLEEERDE